MKARLLRFALILVFAAFYFVACGGAGFGGAGGASSHWDELIWYAGR